MKKLTFILILMIFCFSNCSADSMDLSQSEQSPSTPYRTEDSVRKEEFPEEIIITINGQIYEGELYHSSSAEAFAALLPLSIDMQELNGNEKYYYCPDIFPTDAKKVQHINAGDIMLYGSDCLVLFYQSFDTSYRYTPLGKIKNPDRLAEFAGTETAAITFMKKSK